MTNSLRFLTKPIPIRSWVISALLICYVLVSLFLFYRWVNPSLDGRTDQHIAADSVLYMYFADAIREGNVTPLIAANLYYFPNTSWVPVAIALALKSTVAIVVANYALFFLSLLVLKKTFSFSAGEFLALLILNATTTISLLSVNKEIVDLFTVSLFLFAYVKRKRGLLLLALLFALLNRFEVCIVMIVFLAAQSRLNPLRRRRLLTLVALIMGLTVMLPLFASSTLAQRFEEAENGGIVAFLDSLEMHYLYGLAVIPKIAENLFGELVNFSKWAIYDFDDLANSYILFLNNLSSAVVVFLLIAKRAFTLRSDLIYFAMIGCIFMAVSLVIQPRYFYFVYIVLCLQAAQPGRRFLPDLFLFGNRKTANA